MIPRTSSQPALAAAYAFRRGWQFGLALVLLGLVGCAGIPPNTDRIASYSTHPAVDATPFGRMVVATTPADATRHKLSGLRLLGEVAGAYGSRIALIDGATQTLDLQYYSIHYDGSTEGLLDHLKTAAARGVRVRILVDDFNTGGANARVLRLDETPGISVRVFNPLPGPRLSQAGRLMGALFDFDRIQQRMHNKALIADNTLAVAGGRNLGDEYFGQAANSNFLDLDLLLAGPIVPALSSSFDRYWNDLLAYPAATIWPLADRPKIAEPTPPPLTPKTAGTARATSEPPGRDLAAPISAPPAIANAASDSSAPVPSNTLVEAKQVPGTMPVEDAIRQGKLGLTWAPAILLADKPSKIDPEFDPAPDNAGTSQEAGVTIASADGSPAATVTTPPSPVVIPPAAGSDTTTDALNDAAAVRAADAENGGPTVVDGLITLIAGARHDLLIVSPYFVPGEEMMRTFAQVRARKVRVRVVTNSLASNDAPLAHVGYARYRKALLALGVELFELKASGDTDRRFLGSAPQSRDSLHAKAMVRDGSLMVVGSMNLDLRSQLQNTEVGIVVRSRSLARQLTVETEKVMRDCYRVELSPEGQLRWLSPVEDITASNPRKVLTSEPGASVGLEILIKLIGPFAPETLL